MEKPRPKKALGQNFLADRNVLARIVGLVDIAPHDRVLEVGPGRGALTSLLAEKGAQVLAVELDRELVPLLRHEFAAKGNVEIVQADILDADLPRLLQSRWDGKWKVAANLPYNISSQVLIKFLETPTLFSDLYLMLQKEVGDRLVAPPESARALAVVEPHDLPHVGRLRGHEYVRLRLIGQALGDRREILFELGLAGFIHEQAPGSAQKTVNAFDALCAPGFHSVSC